MPSRARSVARHRGFTLIEMLVALTILGGLLAVTYSGFSVALTMWEKSSERAQVFEQQQTVTGVLRDQIQGALPLLYSTDTGVQQRQSVAFDGRANALRIVSATSWKDGTRAVPRWIEMSWNGSLVIDERLVMAPANTPGAASIWHLELSTFQDLRFRYLRRAQPGRAAEWLDVWNMEEQREFPAAVSIEGTMRGGGERVTLTIPLDYAEANWKGYRVQ